MKLRKSEQALDYIQKSANVLVQTQMQFSPNCLYTMTTSAKLLYQQGKFPETSRIFTSCIGITDKVYESNTLTKGYLLQNLAAIPALMRNSKAALMYHAQAESIFHKFLDEEHPDLLICKNQRENAIGMDRKWICLKRKMYKNTLEDISFDFPKGFFLLRFFQIWFQYFN